VDVAAPVTERRGSLHESAYVPRKPRQFSKARKNGADAAKRGNLAVISMAESRRSATFEARLRDKGICQFCGQPAKDAITLTHFNKGGTWTLSNVALACYPCELAGRVRSCASLADKRRFIRKRRELTADP
jgi:hypothetical protein